MHKSLMNSLYALVAIAATVVLSEARAAEPDTGATAPFTVVVLPDTQFYSESYPDTYLAQAEWIRRRAEADNVRFVFHLGDIVENAAVEQEWIHADRAHRVLDGVVPYSVAPGNHDLETTGDQLTRGSTLYNKYFGPQRFEKHSWYGGHEGETNDNNYCFFEAAGGKYMVLSLEFSPHDDVLRWADGVVASHPDRRVIVATHCYMRPDGRDQKTSQFKGLAGNSGEEIWEKFVRKHPNIFLVVSGHVAGVGHQTSTNDAGLPVHEILADYQKLPEGGDGWLITLRFVPAENVIRVEAYSPTLDEHNADPKHSYTLPFNVIPDNSILVPPNSTSQAAKRKPDASDYCVELHKWAHEDSNLGPRPYQF